MVIAKAVHADGEVHKLGDEQGGDCLAGANVRYQDWVHSKKFFVGDVLYM